MGNPFVAMEELIERDVRISWCFRRLFGIKPKCLMEDLWRNGWKITNLKQ